MAFFSGMLRKADLATIYFIEIFVSNLFDINQSFFINNERVNCIFIKPDQNK